jgi:hypothetical protein
MWVSRRYDILGQIEFLSTYSKVKLLMVGRSLGLSLMSSGSKESIITRLVENRIVSQVVAQVGNLSLEEQEAVNNSYEMLLESNVMGSRTLVQILIDALEGYYVAWLGRRRTGTSMAQLMYLVENPGQFLPEEQYEEQDYNPADIAVNPAMQEAVECGVCYELKSRVKFNCSHEFCKDCVHLMCAHKGENPIKCPMCRGSVTSFEVEDEASREALLVVA